MTDAPDNWTNWMITTIMGALMAAYGFIVYLLKALETKYIGQVNETKTAAILDITAVKNDFMEFKRTTIEEKIAVQKALAECAREKFDYAIKVARYESLLQLQKKEQESLTRSSALSDRVEKLENE